MVGVCCAIIVAVGVVSIHDTLTGPGSVVASAASGPSTIERVQITAQPGDSLWSIAQAHRGAVPIRRYVDKLIDLNGGAAIRAGQRIVLP